VVMESRAVEPTIRTLMVREKQVERDSRHGR
jgi:hypothetical protein